MNSPNQKIFLTEETLTDEKYIEYFSNKYSVEQVKEYFMYLERSDLTDKEIAVLDEFLLDALRKRWLNSTNEFILKTYNDKGIGYYYNNTNPDLVVFESLSYMVLCHFENDYEHIDEDELMQQGIRNFLRRQNITDINK